MQNKKFIKSEPFLQGGDMISDVNVCWVVLDCITENYTAWWTWFTRAMHQKKNIFAKKYIQGLKQEQGQEPWHTAVGLLILMSML